VRHIYLDAVQKEYHGGRRRCARHTSLSSVSSWSATAHWPGRCWRSQPHPRRRTRCPSRTRTTRVKRARACGAERTPRSKACRAPAACAPAPRAHACIALPAVSFRNESQGQLALVIYEWKDVEYLGKVTSDDDMIPVRASSAAQCRCLTVRAEDVCVHIRRCPLGLLRRRPAWALHPRPAPGQVDQRHIVLLRARHVRHPR
jgi:hypothetical protein